MSLFITRECYDFIAYTDTARLNLSLKASECVVGTANSLNRKIESFFLLRGININSFEILKQRNTVVPRNVFGLYGNIVALCCGKRNDVDIVK